MCRAAVDSLLASVTVPPGRKGVLCFLDEPPLLLTGSGAGFDPGACHWWQSALEVAISACGGFCFFCSWKAWAFGERRHR